jgi:hypothetical protein
MDIICQGPPGGLFQQVQTCPDPVRVIFGLPSGYDSGSVQERTTDKLGVPTGGFDGIMPGFLTLHRPFPVMVAKGVVARGIRSYRQRMD